MSSSLRFPKNFEVKMEKFIFSSRVRNLGNYLFAEIDKEKKLLKEKGKDFIDLSVGDPDVLAPQGVIEVLYNSAKEKENQKYALDQGKIELRRAIKEWCRKRFGIKVDEEKEILPLIGSKEGLVHFALAIVDKDYIIIPSPGYPGYRGAAILAEAKIYELPLKRNNNFLPDLDEIPIEVRNKAKLIYLNYPNNPTTAVADRGFLERLVNFCCKYGIIIAYDNAYSEIYFERKPLSLLEIEGAQEVTCEFHSFSKTFCMTGFRIGWAMGNRELIGMLAKIKTNIDSGIFGAVQDAATYALRNEEGYVNNLRQIIKKRRDFFVEGLKRKGIDQVYAESTFYVWAKIPSMFNSSLSFAKYLLKKGIVVTPGIGFGKYGEGFVRFALTVEEEKLKEALMR